MIPYLAVKNAVGRRKLHGRINFQGLPIAVENAKSSSRQWYNPDNGSNGITHMKVPYGYFTGTLGVDGDAVDVYVGPDRESQKVFIVHQRSAPDFTSYDEDKCMLGFNSEDAARVAYLKQYNDTRFLGPITEMTIDELKAKLETHRGRMLKSHIKEYTRQNKSGVLAVIREHYDSRTKTACQIDAPQFKKWFGDSKVVDTEGKPMAVYHGTKREFHAFDLGEAGSNNDTGMWGTGFYFSPNKKMSLAYGDKLKRVYLSIENPLIVNGNMSSVPKEFRPTETHGEAGKIASALQRKHLLAAGYDGVIQYERGDKGLKLMQIVAFHPGQVKSATGNNGDFDPSNADIRKALLKSFIHAFVGGE